MQNRSRPHLDASINFDTPSIHLFKYWIDVKVMLESS